MSFGENLKALREKCGIDRKTMASIFEMPYTTLKNYENDEREPGHRFIIKVARYFDVSADYLLDNDFINTNNALSINNSKKKHSSEALDVATAYDKAEQRQKDTVRLVLGMTEVVDSPREEEDSESEPEARMA